MGIYKLVLAILSLFKVRHTAAFVKEMCINNIQSDNLFGIMRLLEVFGVRSSAVSLDDSKDFKELELPYIYRTKDKTFHLVTQQDGDSVKYTDGITSKTLDWKSFIKNADLLAVMLDADENVSEPGYAENHKKEMYQKCLWVIPFIWFLWLMLMQFAEKSYSSIMPTVSFRVFGIVLSALGLFLCVLLHRQWTGDSNAVERVCSLFKTSNCSSSHDTFFFNKWFDLSEVGASYFAAIILVLSLIPQKAYSVAWVILPALPASLWNLCYQFFKQKHWCPLCVSVQVLFWIIALVFFLCGAYNCKDSFNLFDVLDALLLWGSVLVVIMKFVTPSVSFRHKAESAGTNLSLIKGNPDVVTAILGEKEKGVRNIIIAVSPTCPYCKRAMDKIESLLMPTGRFTVEKKYKSIHKGDDEKIEDVIGKEEAERHRQWCDEHNINATPTVFVNGKELNRIYSVDDLLYL